MKNAILCLLLAFVSLSLFGCQKEEINIRDCNSEITKIYFNAKCEGLRGSISVGQREKKYIVDGVHTPNCDFSLISLKFEEQLASNIINVELKINNEISQCEFELNPANHYYMYDLGYALTGEEIIQLSFYNYRLEFSNVSKTFNVDYNRAIDIAIEQFGKELESYYQKGNFKGETYLMILAQSEDDSLFWMYTIVSQGKTNKRIVINVNDGSILLKN